MRKDLSIQMTEMRSYFYFVDPCLPQFSYVKDADGCYRFDFTSKWNFADGRTRCQDQGADLLTLKTTTVQNAVKDYIKRGTKSCPSMFHLKNPFDCMIPNL